MTIQSPDCPNHVQLDLYLLGSDQGALAWIGEHLRICPVCRAQAARRRADFVAYASAISSQAQSDRSRVFAFVPWKDDPQNSDTAFRLAAKGAEKEEVRASLTMISTDQQILMKVVRDHKTGEAWLYLLSDKPEVCRHALVFPFLMKQGFVTDATGRVNLGKIAWPSDDQLTAEIRLPTATFHLAPLVQFEPGKPQMIESSDGDILRITYHSEGQYRRLDIQIMELRGVSQDSPLRLAVCEREGTRLQVLHPALTRATSIDGVQDSGAIELYLYQ